MHNARPSSTRVKTPGSAPCDDTPSLDMNCYTPSMSCQLGLARKAPTVAPVPSAPEIVKIVKAQLGMAVFTAIKTDDSAAASLTAFVLTDVHIVDNMYTAGTDPTTNCKSCPRR